MTLKAEYKIYSIHEANYLPDIDCLINMCTCVLPLPPLSCLSLSLSSLPAWCSVTGMRKISRRIFGGKNHHSSSKHSSEEDVDESGSPAMSGAGSAVATGHNSSHAPANPMTMTTASASGAPAGGQSAVNQSGCNSSTSSARHLIHQHNMSAGSGHNHNQQAITITPEPAVVVGPVDLEPLFSQLKEQRDECTRLQEELHSLKSQHQKDCSLLHQSLQEERYRFEVCNPFSMLFCIPGLSYQANICSLLLFFSHAARITVHENRG